MIKQINPIQRSAPNLVISQRVLDKMALAARHYVTDETGEALVGLITPSDNTKGVPTVYVLDTISPDETAVRQPHTFQQGDERQDEVIWWLQENWHTYRQTSKDHLGRVLAPKFQVPLRYLGDWHKQPGMMVAPSQEDLRTARDWLNEPNNDMDFLLAPIVTMGYPQIITNDDTDSNFITCPQSSELLMRVDFWFLDNEVPLFRAITPTLYADDKLPVLPEYPWHLKDQDRYNQEMFRLNEDKLFTAIVLWDADHTSPLEICIMAARVGSDRVLLIVTQWDYPNTAPQARVAPFKQMGPNDQLYDMFARMWAASEPVADPPGWSWAKHKYLIDYIRALEVSLGMVTSTQNITPEPASPQETPQATTTAPAVKPAVTPGPTPASSAPSPAASVTPTPTTPSPASATPTNKAPQPATSNVTPSEENGVDTLPMPPITETPPKDESV